MRFLLSTPIAARIRDGEAKGLLRRAVANLLSPAARRRIDKTNYTPYLAWSLRTHLRPRLETLAHRGSECLDPYIDWSRGRPMIEAFLSGRPAPLLALWRILALERWLMRIAGSKGPATP